MQHPEQVRTVEEAQQILATEGATVLGYYYEMPLPSWMVRLRTGEQYLIEHRLFEAARGKESYRTVCNQ